MCAVFLDRKEIILFDFLEPEQITNFDCYAVMLAKLKSQTCRVRPEKKTFLLQHKNMKSHCILKCVEHTADFGWTVLSQSPHSLALEPFDFHLFWH